MQIAHTRRSTLERWRYTLWKYSAVLHVSIANNLAYVSEVIFRSLMLAALIFNLTQLWKTTFALQRTEVLSGFSIAGMAWYLMGAEAIAMSMPVLTRRIDEEVRSGHLAYQLVRPCSYILYNFARYLGERLVRWTLNCLVGAALAWLIAGPISFTWQGLLAWPLVSLMAMGIDFIAAFGIGLLAFWSEETQAFYLIYSRLVLVLGGVLAPLEVFPQPFRSIAQYLPFAAILYGPARTLVQFDLERFGWLLLQQALFLVVGGTILLMIYRLAIRRVNINGG
jgi:ABC-2 type transport system permease protein